MTNARPVIVSRQPPESALRAFDDLDPVLARLYALRGVDSSSELDYSLQNLLPIGSLQNVESAAELVLANRERRIVVIGDFDVDGATSTALLLRCFREFGFTEVEYLVPNRFDFGYGLTPEIVAVAAERDPALIVTVDNGISSVAGVAAANARQIPVLITDHHLPGDTLPDAAIILNPNLADSTFRSRNLAGVGVAFYLVAEIGRQLQQAGHSDAARIPARYLDLVALGTVADVVPLDRNNRILVSQGLRRIQAGQAVPGIGALLRVAGRRPERTVASDLGFAAGPRINAAGRLQDISVGIECLLSDDQRTVDQHARVLDRINGERRDIEATMREQAFRYVDRLGEQRWPACVCVFDPQWHQGVVGLIAARVRERCHRPVIAFAEESHGQLKGSARSIPGVHVRDLLEAVNATAPSLIEKFGGHAMAAGLTLAADNYERFALVVAEQMQRLYPDADFSGTLQADGGLPATALSLQFARVLRAAGPWGAAFQEPLWCGDFEIVEQRVVGENHLKMNVRPAEGGPAVDAIAFNQAGPVYRGVVQLVYRLDVNEYRGNETVQLIVEQVTAIDTGMRERGAC